MDSFQYRIRAIQPEKDAAAIAELIKRCFRPWLDDENITYLDRLRSVGREALSHPFLTKITGFPYNLPGVVCTDKNGNILGVINTYSFYQNTVKCVLLSNVCTDPFHRKEGIASHMLAEVERLQRAENAYGLYLQTRMDRRENFLLYKRNGFSVTDFRDTWILPKSIKKNSAASNEYTAGIVSSGQMDDFHSAFRLRYPASILWSLDYPSTLFRPGKLAAINNRISAAVNRFLFVRNKSGQTKAWAAFQKLSGSMDQLWFIPEKETGNEEVPDILCFLVREYKGSKALKLDVPAGTASDIYEKSGFTRQHTLAWMWKKL